MKRIQGSDLYVPDDEKHLLSRDRKGRPIWRDYQKKQLDKALEYVTDFSLAVDVGAHVGLMTRMLAKRFERVYAFEPNPDSYKCLFVNTAGHANVTLFPHALGDMTTSTSIIPNTKGNTGDCQLAMHGDGIPIKKLDNVLNQSFGFIKVDVQGYEWQVLKGAEESILAFMPVIMVEMEPPGKLQHVFYSVKTMRKMLARWDVMEQAVVGADHIYSFGASGSMPYTKYHKFGDYHWQKFARGKNEEVFRDTIQYINEKQHHSILEIGCGDGLLTHMLGENACGIDSNALAVKLAKGHGVKAKHLSAHRVLELHQKYAAVCLFDTFEHLPRQELLLDMLRQITDTLYILNPDPCESVFHFREFTADQLKLLAMTRGWELVFSRRWEMSERNKKTFMHFKRVT